MHPKNLFTASCLSDTYLIPHSSQPSIWKRKFYSDASSLTPESDTTFRIYCKYPCKVTDVQCMPSSMSLLLPHCSTVDTGHSNWPISKSTCSASLLVLAPFSVSFNGCPSSTHPTISGRHYFWSSSCFLCFLLVNSVIPILLAIAYTHIPIFKILYFQNWDVVINDVWSHNFLYRVEVTLKVSEKEAVGK